MKLSKSRTSPKIRIDLSSPQAWDVLQELENESRIELEVSKRNRRKAKNARILTKPDF